MAVLYRGSLFNQSGWIFYLISYLVCFLEEIIQDKPTWCNFLFNKKLVLIYLTVLTYKGKTVLLSQLLYLAAQHWKTFNNKSISDISVSMIRAVFFTMEWKGKHWTVSFILISQYVFLSQLSISFYLKVYSP